MPSRPSGPARLLGLLLLAGALGPAPCAAQTAPPAQPGSPTQSGQPLTLSVQSRLVVEDVLVFDRDGHPIFGLPSSAFHLSDNGHTQTLRDFEEGSATSLPATPASSLPPGTFQNTSSATSHTASDILLIDADSMSLPDQMYLLDQLSKSLDTLPPGLAVAVFRVSNTRVVQIRGLETDRADLRRALRECLPVVTRPVDNPFNSAVDQLLTVSAYLEETPGRKNILWFAGAFPLVSFSDAEAARGVSPDVQARLHIIHQLQEGLAEARVSVYPVDVRGVIPGGPTTLVNSGSSSRSLTVSPSAFATSALPSRSPLGAPASGAFQERAEMHNLADATGGRAYTLNHLAPEITEAFTLGLRAYALAYAPSPYQNDDSWHHVRIAVDTPPGVAGPLSLAYRPGYLATWSGVAGGRTGIRLDPKGARVATGGIATAPLPFKVHIEPGTPDPAHPNLLPIHLRFGVPTGELDFRHTPAGWHNELALASYAYNAEGRIKGGTLQQLKSTVSDSNWATAQGTHLPASQNFAVPRSAAYLMLELRDAGSGRAGSLMLPMRVVRSLVSAQPAQPAPPGSPQPGEPSPPPAP